LIELDPATLEETVNVWNKDAANGKDPVFGRKKVAPIDTPPFYAGFIHNYAGYNYGGLMINTKAQVMDVYGNVISRLYGAGTTTGGCLGKIHLGAGTLLSKSMTFGRIAGKNAAAEKPLASKGRIKK
jgi:succinate dehydrogenase/fumarate reductase flavoprotein subunit